MPAVIILAFAYALNDLSAALNTADYVVSITEVWLTPQLLPVLVFLITGVVAFSTGTSWGTYAIMVPIAIPLAFSFSGDQLSPLIYCTWRLLLVVVCSGITARRCQTPRFSRPPARRQTTWTISRRSFLMR